MPPAFLYTIEETALSYWLRESSSPFAFWLVITFHAIGMGLLVGASTVIGLRMLGVARDLPLAPLKYLYPFIWVGFGIQVVSGVLLFTAYPTKAFTNVVFHLKLALIALAMTAMVRLKRQVFDDSSLSEAAMLVKGRSFATWALIFWVGALTAGRFMAYTATHLIYPLSQSVVVNASAGFVRSLSPPDYP